MYSFLKNSTLPYSTSITLIKEKHKQIEAIMKNLGIECWLVYARETEVNNEPILPFILGNDIVWGAVFLFFMKEKFTKVALVGNFDASTEEDKGIWDQVLGYKERLSVPLRKMITNYNPANIALDYSTSDVSADGLSHGMFLNLQSMLEGIKIYFISAEKIIQFLRSVKTETELELIKKSCLVAEDINREMTEKKIKPDRTEIAIQKDFHDIMDRLEVIESWQRRSCPAVDAGPDKEFGHVGPSDIVTKAGHTLHNDFGVKWQAYSSDLQRMWFFGTKDQVPNELRHAFETVKGAIRKASQEIRPGKKGFEIDKIARDYVISRGYEEYAHALGHQVGRATHDGGTLLGPLWERYGDSPNGAIAKNNVFTLELYVKTKNYGMVSLEEMIVITDEGCKFIVPPLEDFIYIT